MTENGLSQEPFWWQRGVVYQIYPRSFQDTNADGIGDIPGIVDRFPYLAETLGIDAIWLSPFYPSPMKDFGYDVSDYCNVHPMFGTLADFDRLVEIAHRHGIRIIVDFVPNHSSDQHPWFVESRSSRNNPKRDWYVWRDARPDGSPPNNWLAAFGGPSWEWDEHTGQYYLHSFLIEQPDLNWRNPEVQRAMLDVLRFWMDHGVDGFRIDVAHFIMKDPALRDNPPNPDAAAARRPHDTQLHVFDRGHADVHEAFRWIRRTLDEREPRGEHVAIGEIHEYHWPTWATYFGANLDELHLPFNFGLIHTSWEAEIVRAVVDELEAALPPGAWPNYVLGNHDEHRIASRVGPAQARVAMMLLLTLRGTPTMYYGDEIGMHDVDIPQDRLQDPFEINQPDLGLGRDPERTPMQWDGSPHAGFCPPNVSPWLPIAEDYREVNAKAELEQDRSMLSLTRALLLLRRENAALRSGKYRPLDAPPGCYVYERALAGQRFVVALNFTGDHRKVELPDMVGTIRLNTSLTRANERIQATLNLDADEACVVQVENQPERSQGTMQ